MKNDENEKKEINMNNKSPEEIIFYICISLNMILNLILIGRAIGVGEVTITSYVFSCISNIIWSMTTLFIALTIGRIGKE